MPKKTSWPSGFFDLKFYNPASPAAVAAAPREAAFMSRALGLEKGMRLLDLCCGPGRHSLEFARRGICVTGVDITEAYLRLARAAAGRKKLPVEFVRGDMLRLGYRGEFNAALNAFTSFGYFSRAQDLRVLKGVARALKPGGRFLIDLLDRAWLEKNFRRKSWEILEDGSYLLKEDKYYPAARRLDGCWTLLRPGQPVRTRSLRLNLYDERELAHVLRRAGLAPARRWHSLGQGGVNNRLVMLAVKPR